MKTNKSFLKWIRGRRSGTAPILDSADRGFEYSDYLAWCEANGVEPGGEDSEAFCRWCADEADMNYREDLSQLIASKHLRGSVLVTGTVGRWNGSFDIVPEIIHSFKEAWKKILTNDTLDVDACYDTQCIHVNGHHHDATNRFQVWILKPGADLAAVQKRIDDGTFDPLCAFDRRFLQPITDYLI